MFRAGQVACAPPICLAAKNVLGTVTFYNHPPTSPHCSLPSLPIPSSSYHLFLKSLYRARQRRRRRAHRPQQCTQGAPPPSRRSLSSFLIPRSPSPLLQPTQPVNLELLPVHREAATHQPLPFFFGSTPSLPATALTAGTRPTAMLERTRLSGNGNRTRSPSSQK